MPHISTMMPSSFLKKEDFPQQTLLTIRRFTHENVAPNGQPEERKWIMHFDEFERGLVMNPTNLQLAAVALGSENTDDWIGKQIVAYNDPNVSFGGKLTGGIRLRAKRTRTAVMTATSSIAPPPPPPPAFADMEDDVPF